MHVTFMIKLLIRGMPRLFSGSQICVLFWPQFHKGEFVGLTYLPLLSHICVSESAKWRPFCPGAGEDPRSQISWGQHGPAWVMSAPYGPHVGPMNLVIGDELRFRFIFTVSQKRLVDVTSTVSNSYVYVALYYEYFANNCCIVYKQG